MRSPQVESCHTAVPPADPCPPRPARPARHGARWWHWLGVAPPGATSGSAGAPAPAAPAPAAPAPAAPAPAAPAPAAPAPAAPAPADVAGDDAWTQLLRLLPDNLDATARATGALERRRGVGSATTLLWLVLAYAVADWALRLVA